MFKTLPGWAIMRAASSRTTATVSLRAGTVLGWVAALPLLACPTIGQAQTIQSYFPPGNYGYDQELGVTVLTRARPLYETPSLHLGSFNVTPTLDESLFFNSNVTGNPGSGSWGSSTSGAVSAFSDWTRNNLAASLGFTHNQFFALPAESYTDWNVGLAGGYTIGDGSLQAAYSHQTYNQIGINVGAVASETPIQNQTDSANLAYSFNLARFTIMPIASFTAYRFGTASSPLGTSVNLQIFDRNVVAAGLITRYSLSEEGSLLVVLRGLNSNFLNSIPGQPTNNSNSVQALAGFDYQAKGLWRYRLLVGVESRMFEASQYPTHTGPIIEGSVIWTPTELTTLTGTVARAIEDPETLGTNGYTLTQASLVADHELRRNVFLQARGSLQTAQYLQSGGGTQTGFSLGAGATWLFSRRIRLQLAYAYSEVTGSSSTNASVSRLTQPTGAFTQSLVTLTLRLAL